MKLLLRSLVAMVVLLAAGFWLLRAAEPQAAELREYYELRTYQIDDSGKQSTLLTYLETGLVPALNRAGLDRVGVFTVYEMPEDLSVHMIIAYPDMAAFVGIRSRLEKDEPYLKAAEAYYDRPQEDPLYSRIESRFMKAFVGMPTMEIPKESKAKQARLFEVRIYESHNEEMGRRKIDMFNSGEIQIMRDVELAPLLYGETLIGDNVPNLTYILSAPDMTAHRKHWEAFSAHPEWQRMRSMPKYQGTVSGIVNYFLVPTAFSQI